MAKAEDTVSPAEKLEIREEVTRQFNEPPAAFTKLIEDEVEKRVSQRVKGYKTMLGFAIVAGTIVLGCLGLATTERVFNTVVEKIEDKIFTGVFNEVTNSIAKTKAQAETDGQFISTLSQTATASNLAFINMVEMYSQTISGYSNEARMQGEYFKDQITILRTKGSAVALEDLAKLIVVQTVTNLKSIQQNDYRFELDYEPIPGTAQIAVISSFARARTIIERGSRVEGKTLFLSSHFAALPAYNQTDAVLRVEYVRKPTLK